MLTQCQVLFQDFPWAIITTSFTDEKFGAQMFNLPKIALWTNGEDSVQENPNAQAISWAMRPPNGPVHSKVYYSPQWTLPLSPGAEKFSGQINSFQFRIWDLWGLQKREWGSFNYFSYKNLRENCTFTPNMFRRQIKIASFFAGGQNYFNSFWEPWSFFSIFLLW